MKFPAHKCDLQLSHNSHLGYYDTAENWIAENTHYQWKDESSKQKALDTGEIWTLQWYPDTPIGSYAVVAPTLEELLEYANENE